VGRVLARADVIIASSALMQDRLTPLVGATPVVRLPNPVDIEGIRRSTDPSADPAPVEPDPPTGSTDRRVEAVVVARLVPQKGHDDLLRALAAIDRDDLHATIIGDGPLRADLVTLRDGLGLRDRVTFTGRIDDRAELATRLSRADLLIQPARYEGMPNTVLEALALGTPVLATDDLGMLQEIAAGAAPGAVRLVPRRSLAEALLEVRPQPGPRPRPSLLPGEHDRDTVTERLEGLLLRDPPSPSDGPQGQPGA
jgi:glycosyltransferase involved in cell wall biosynthesis